MKGILSTTDLDDASLVAKAQAKSRAGRPRPGARGHAPRVVRLGAGLDHDVSSSIRAPPETAGKLASRRAGRAPVARTSWRSTSA